MPTTKIQPVVVHYNFWGCYIYRVGRTYTVRDLGNCSVTADTRVTVAVVASKTAAEREAKAYALSCPL